MKRNIKVKEQELISRLNTNLNGNLGKGQNPLEAKAIDEDAEKEVIRQGTTSVADLVEAIKEYKDTQLRTPFTEEEATNCNTNVYEYVNHPKHYNNYDIEVIDMMEKVFGREATISFCTLNAFKYRMRAGTKPNISADQDLKKEQWYLNKAKELKNSDCNRCKNPYNENKSIL